MTLVQLAHARRSADDCTHAYTRILFECYSTGTALSRVSIFFHYLYHLHNYDNHDDKQILDNWCKKWGLL